jgi:hypothetical protein
LLGLNHLSSVAQSNSNLEGSVNDFIQAIKPSTNKQNRSKKIEKSNSNHSFVINSTTKNGLQEVLTGEVLNDENSVVYFNYHNNSINGKVIIPSQKKAFKYYTENGNVFSTPIDIEKEYCMEYPNTKGAVSQKFSAKISAASSDPYNLQSLPGAAAVLMLDFDGHDATGSWWGNIVAASSNSTNSDIVEAWNIISEDFRPFAVNVTTSEAVYQTAPSNLRMRCIFTPTTDAAPQFGGVAFIGSFQTGGELAPCWVFNLGSGKVMGETGAHELGHTVGLFHDGRDFPNGNHEEYYGGQDDWAPIMGVSYYLPISQWSKGEYQYANNQQDDINVIATQNGFSYRPDDQGNIPAMAQNLPIDVNGNVSGYGIIQNQADVDYFGFSVDGSASINLVVSPTTVVPDLDMVVSLLDQSGNIVVSVNPPKIGSCTLNTTVSAGYYYIKVDGSGYADPFTNGYSDYASIGEYTITGTIQGKISTGVGISGSSCVLPGQTYTFSLTTDPETSFGINWWVSGDASLVPNPSNPKQVTVVFSPYNSSPISINAGANFNSAPWYTHYQLNLEVGGCAPSSNKTGITSDHEVSVTVYDLQGRKIESAKTTDLSNYSTNLNLPSGVYLIEVEDENGAYTTKFAK